MKIVIILDWFLYYSVELANALAHNHDVLLVTRDHAFEISSPEESTTIDSFLDAVLDPGVKRLKLRFRRGALANLKEVPRVLLQIKKFKPDVVHVQETTDWRILFITKMFSKQKRILTVHDVISHPGEENGLLDVIKRMLRRSASKIIVHGNYLKDLLHRNYPNLHASIQVIPHGVLSSYKKWDVVDVVEEEMTILFFGRISRYKGLDILLEAHRLVLKSLPLATLIIAGKGDTFPEDDITIAQHQHMEIHHRFIPNSEVPCFFRRASVLVLPYTEASQSGVVPIAYAFSKPVVVTAVGSIPEVVKEGVNGFIVPPNDAKALAEALIKILSDKSLRLAMGQNAKKIADTELSWDSIAKRTESIYSTKF